MCSNCWEPRVCSNITMVALAPILDASRGLPTASTGGRRLTSQNRRRESGNTSMSKLNKSRSFLFELGLYPPVISS